MQRTEHTARAVVADGAELLAERHFVDALYTKTRRRGVTQRQGRVDLIHPVS